MYRPRFHLWFNETIHRPKNYAFVYKYRVQTISSPMVRECESIGKQKLLVRASSSTTAEIKSVTILNRFFFMENRVYSLNHCGGNWRKLPEFLLLQEFSMGTIFWSGKDKGENQNKTPREMKCLRVFLKRMTEVKKKKSVWDRVVYRVNENTWPPKDLISFLNDEKWCV